MFFFLCVCRLFFLDWFLYGDFVFLMWIGKDSSKVCYLEIGLNYLKLWVVCFLLRFMKDNENFYYLVDCIVFLYLL